VAHQSDQASRLLTASLDYAPTEVTLELMSAMAQFQGLTPNQQAVGGVLDDVFNASGGLPGGLDALFSLSAEQLPGALDALSGEAHASQQSVLVNDSFYARQAVLARLRQISYAGEAGPQAALAYAGETLSYSPADPVVSAAMPALLDNAETTQAIAADPAPRSGLNFWAQAYGGWSSMDGDGNASRISSDIGGVISGADLRMGEDGWAGIALGYSRSGSEIGGALASSADIDTAFISLYASTNFDAWRLRGGAVYGWSQLDTSRAIAFPGFADRASADYDAGLGQIFGEIGYGMAIRGVAVEPFGGLSWVHLDRDGFTETGGVAALTGAGATSNIGYAALGVRLATDLALADGSLLTPHASLAWQHAFGDRTPAAALAFAGIAGSNFTVAGVPLAANELLVDIGAELHVDEAVTLGISYFGKFAEDARDNTVKGGVSWRF
jgi:outer membrane autotransporter protein